MSLAFCVIVLLAASGCHAGHGAPFADERTPAGRSPTTSGPERGALDTSGSGFTGTYDAASTGDTRPTTTTTVRMDPEVLFVRNCAVCHGSEGQGDIGPDLRGLAPELVEDVQRVISEGGSLDGHHHQPGHHHTHPMPAFEGQLTEAQIEVMAEFILGF